MNLVPLSSGLYNPKTGKVQEVVKICPQKEILHVFRDALSGTGPQALMSSVAKNLTARLPGKGWRLRKGYFGGCWGAIEFYRTRQATKSDLREYRSFLRRQARTEERLKRENEKEAQRKAEAQRLAELKELARLKAKYPLSG